MAGEKLKPTATVLQSQSDPIIIKTVEQRNTVCQVPQTRRGFSERDLAYTAGGILRDRCIL